MFREPGTLSRYCQAFLPDNDDPLTVAYTLGVEFRSSGLTVRICGRR
jgi:hypothetical protein